MSDSARSWNVRKQEWDNPEGTPEWERDLMKSGDDAQLNRNIHEQKRKAVAMTDVTLDMNVSRYIREARITDLEVPADLIGTQQMFTSGGHWVRPAESTAPSASQRTPDQKNSDVLARIQRLEDTMALKTAMHDSAQAASKVWQEYMDDIQRKLDEESQPTLPIRFPQHAFDRSKERVERLTKDLKGAKEWLDTWKETVRVTEESLSIIQSMNDQLYDHPHIEQEDI